MNSRERVIRTLNFQETDRVPLDFGGRLNDLMRHYNAPDADTVKGILGIDFRQMGWLFHTYRGPERTVNGYAADYWGVPKECGVGDTNVLCPLSEIMSVDQVEGYAWPSADDFCYDSVESDIDAIKDYYVTANVWAPFFHNFTWLCGFENSLMYLASEPEITKSMLRNIMDFWLEYTRNVLERGRGRIDCVGNYNDFGSQKGMIMSPKTWRTFFKPELKRLYDLIKGHGAKVFQHSCGAVAEIIPDLIEIGVDILNPVQVAADGMDPGFLGREFGGKIVFHGGIDTQHVLPKATEAEVRAEVGRIIRTLGEKGGYILCGTQEFMDDIPIGNIVAVYEEAKNHPVLKK